MESNGTEADDESINEVVVKKRGRKPKIVSLEPETETEAVSVPKKRGRKPKNPDEEENKSPKEKKKRGRKPKIVDPDSADVPRIRKRGRRPKCPVKSISEIREKFKNTGDLVKFPPTSEIINENHSKTHVPFGNLNIILHKPPEIDTTELRNFYKTNNKIVSSPKKVVVEEGYNSSIQSESESEVERKICNKKFVCKCNDKELKVTGIELVKSEKKKVNKQLMKFSSKLDECGRWPTKTNILCWWCCHNFTTMPIPSVVAFDQRTKRYHLKGVFCSWECSCAFTSENNRNYSFLYKLFKEWTGENSNKIIEKAPPRFVLKAFGGHMGINEFRKSPYETREVFLSENNRMSYINQDIIEVYNEMEKKKKNKLKLSRKKPLRNNTQILFSKSIIPNEDDEEDDEDEGDEDEGDEDEGNEDEEDVE